MNGSRFPEPASVTPRLQPQVVAPATTSAPIGVRGQGADDGLPAVFWRRRWTILLLTLAGLAAGMVYLWNATPLYRSESQIYVQSHAPQILDERGGGFGSDYLHTQARILRSTAVLAKAIESPQTQQVLTLQVASNPVGRLRSGISVDVDRHGEIMTVSMTSPEAADAAVLVNAVVESYIDYQDQQQRSTTADVLRILRDEKDKAEAQHRGLSERMLAFQREHGTLSFESADGNIVANRLARLSSQLTEAEARSRELGLLWAQAQEVTDQPQRLRLLLSGSMGRIDLGALEGNANAADPASEVQHRLAAQLDELRLQLALREAELGPNHRLVERLRRQMNVLRAEHAAYAGPSDASRHRPEPMSASESYLLMLEQQWRTAQHQKADIREAYEQQKAEAMGLNAKAAEYRQMQSEMSRVDRQLDTLDNRIRQINVTEDTGMMNVSVLEVAQASGSPVHPVPSRILAMGLLTGLLLGCGGAMVQEWADQRIRSAEEAALVLQAPVLGVIPHEQLSTSRARRGRALLEHSKSDVAEAFRTLRTAVYFGTSEGCPKTLLVTSPGSEEGKTTISANLAIAFAQTGARVLIIDGDCRRPMQHKIFELQDGVGLSSVLMGNATLDQAVRTTEVEHLDVLVCGPVPSNPSEMLNSQAFQDLLASARQKYDQVILDAPPVGPVTDARIIAAAADATLLVVRAERSTRRPSLHAREALQGVGAQVIGLAINDVTRGGGRYGYYGYAYYGRDHERDNGALSNGNGGDRKAGDERWQPQRLAKAAGPGAAEPDGTSGGTGAG